MTLATRNRFIRAATVVSLVFAIASIASIATILAHRGMPIRNRIGEGYVMEEQT